MDVRLTSGYTFGVRLRCSIAEARARVEPALKAEGFGILNEIDLAATFKAKLGLDHASYLILGVCNPGLASKAVTADPSVGTLLPCKVVLRDDDGVTVAEFLDPVVALGVASLPGAEPIAAEARERLMRVAAALVGK
jgi:uncharacterized protein (DUF302 family)